jgi:hypothetical protein
MSGGTDTGARTPDGKAHRLDGGFIGTGGAVPRRRGLEVLVYGSFHVKGANWGRRLARLDGGRFFAERSERKAEFVKGREGYFPSPRGLKLWVRFPDRSSAAPVAPWSLRI